MQWCGQRFSAMGQRVKVRTLLTLSLFVEGWENMSYALEELQKQFFSITTLKIKHFEKSRVQEFLELVKNEKECFSIFFNI